MSNTKLTKRKFKQKMSNQSDEMLKLPFVSTINKKPCYWDVKPTGDHETDCKTGEEYATLAMNFIFETNFTPFLGWIVLSMKRTQKHSGIEIGFMSTISNAAFQHWRYDYTLRKVKEAK